jgi:hypothetical protein
MIEHSPRPGEIEASAGLIVPDAVRRYGCVLVEEGISRAKLRSLEISEFLEQMPAHCIQSIMPDVPLVPTAPEFRPV